MAQTQDPDTALTPCPACGVTLARVPKRVGTCAACGVRLVRMYCHVDPAEPLLTGTDARDVIQAHSTRIYRMWLWSLAQGVTGLELDDEMIVRAARMKRLCDVCRAGEGARSTLRGVMSGPATLPHAGCSCGPNGGVTGVCRCAYVPTRAHAPWPESGKLVAVLDARPIIEEEGFTSWTGPQL